MWVKKIILGIVLFVVVSACLYLATLHWIAPATGPTTGRSIVHSMAPDFTLTSLSGDTISMKNLRGKVVLLNFWATWCGPCRMEIPGLERLQSRYGPQGLRVIGMDEISEDNANAVRRFYHQFQLNYPVVLASDRVGDLYGGILGTPTSILIGCDGRIYGKYVGYTSESFFARQIHDLLMACPNGQPSAPAQGALIMGLHP